MNIRHDESTARFLTDADFAGVRTYALQVAPPTQATNLSACAGGPFHHSGVGYQLTSLPDLDPPAKRRKRKSRAKPKEKWVALAVPDSAPPPDQSDEPEAASAGGADDEDESPTPMDTEAPPPPNEETPGAASATGESRDTRWGVRELPPGYMVREDVVGCDASGAEVKRMCLAKKRVYPPRSYTTEKGRTPLFSVRATKERRPLLDEYATQFGYFGAPPPLGAPSDACDHANRPHTRVPPCADASGAPKWDSLLWDTLEGRLLPASDMHSVCEWYEEKLAAERRTHACELRAARTQAGPRATYDVETAEAGTKRDRGGSAARTVRGNVAEGFKWLGLGVERLGGSSLMPTLLNVLRGGVYRGAERNGIFGPTPLQAMADDPVILAKMTRVVDVEVGVVRDGGEGGRGGLEAAGWGRVDVQGRLHEAITHQVDDLGHRRTRCDLGEVVRPVGDHERIPQMEHVLLDLDAGLGGAGEDADARLERRVRDRVGPLLVEDALVGRHLLQLLADGGRQRVAAEEEEALAGGAPQTAVGDPIGDALRVDDLRREEELGHAPMVVLLGVGGAGGPKQGPDTELLHVGVGPLGADEAGVGVVGPEHVADEVGAPSGGGVDGGGQHDRLMRGGGRTPSRSRWRCEKRFL